MKQDEHNPQQLDFPDHGDLCDRLKNPCSCPCHKDGTNIKHIRACCNYSGDKDNG